jgi:NodT family efflux transporter outer membrane factor (OMF) lipoprotein
MRLATLALLLTMLLSSCAKWRQNPIATHSTEIVQRPLSAPDLALLKGFQQLFPDDVAAQAALRSASMRNLDIQVAQSNIRQARALAAASATTALPQLDASLEPSRTRASARDPLRRSTASDAPRNSTRWQSGLSLNWTLDPWGEAAAQANAALARVDAEEARLVDTQLAVLADVSANLIDLRSVQARTALARRSVAIDRELQEITQAKQRGGELSSAEVLRAQSQQRKSEAELVELAVEKNSKQKALAILLGRTLPELDKIAADDVPLPASVSVKLWLSSAELLQRRPDIIAARAELAAADSELASAVAARLPTLTLAGSIGWLAGTVADLGSSQSLSSALTPRLSWTLLDFGQRRAEIDRRDGARSEALARFRDAINQAFVGAASARAALDLAEQAVAARRLAADTQSSAAELTLLQYRSGVADFGAALDARREQNIAEQAYVLAVAEACQAALIAMVEQGGAPMFTASEH